MTNESVNQSDTICRMYTFIATFMWKDNFEI